MGPALSSRHGLEIRAAVGTDAPGLAELLRLTGHDVAPRILAGRLGALQNDGGTALLASEWGPPSGLVVLHRYRRLDADLPTAQVTTLVVGPDDRRRGIGRLLLKAAAQAARVAGCGTLRVSVSPDQEGLAEFCRAVGFAEADAGFVRALRKKRNANEA